MNMSSSYFVSFPLFLQLLVLSLYDLIILDVIGRFTVVFLLYCF